MKQNIRIALSILLLGLLLTACAAADSTDLKDTSWVLVEISGQPVVEGTSPTLVFESEQAGGNGSCNSFGGSYEAGNGKLTFGPLVSTLMYCENVMDQEIAYLAALQDATGYEIRDGILLILDADGLVVLIFEPQ
jgi:heat shock protein HslJ